LAAAGPAGGQTDPEVQRAREIFKRAEVHFSLGEFPQALKLYKEAFRTKQLPEFLFNIGQCYRHLGNCKEAMFYFRQFLLHQPEAPERRQVKDLILECEAKVAAEEVSEPTSRPARLPSVPPPPVSRTWFWVGVGVSGGLLTTSLVTGLVALDKSSSADNARSPSRRKDLEDDAEALSLTSWITLGLGVAAAGGTVALYFLSNPREPPAEAGPGVALLPTRGGGLLQLSGRF
jgi:tetratricopeptide (TPR) repeat protein